MPNVALVTGVTGQAGDRLAIPMAQNTFNIGTMEKRESRRSGSDLDSREAGDSCEVQRHAQLSTVRKG
jgi:GDP-D-mannose dehydratase